MEEKIPFVTPTIEIIVFDTEDIITTSDPSSIQDSTIYLPGESL